MEKSTLVISIILIPILFSCATTQQTQVESGDAKFYYTRGTEYGKKGQYDQAIPDYTKAVEIDPKYSTKAYANRGNAYVDKGEYDLANSDYTKALEINPKDARVYFDRGWTYYLKKEYHKSWKDINKAQELGYQVPPKYLDELRKASGREK